MRWNVTNTCSLKGSSYLGLHKPSSLAGPFVNTTSLGKISCTERDPDWCQRLPGRCQGAQHRQHRHGSRPPQHRQTGLFTQKLW